jgi:phosphate transport system substrate-binding protein
MKFVKLFLLTALWITGCNILYRTNTVIKIKGSDTMLSLTKRLTEEYSKENENVKFIVEGGGTSAGIKSLSHKEIELATTSRNLEPSEVKFLAEKFGTVGVSTSIAKDALCVYVNKINPINNLSLKEIKEIFTGKISNWKELGWIDGKISVYIRNNNSGSLHMFKRIVMEDDEFNSKVDSLESNIALHNAVQMNKSAITFSGIFKSSGCKKISVDNISPTNDNINSGYYPLARYLHFYTLNTPQGEIKKFIDWVLSSRGQKIIEEEGFYSLFNYSLD